MAFAGLRPATADKVRRGDVRHALYTRPMPWKKLPAPGQLCGPRVWRHLPLEFRKILLARVADSERRHRESGGQFPDAWARLLWLKRCLGGHVTAFVHGRAHLARIGRKGLAKQGAAKGGRATLRRYGREHLQLIGRRGAAVRWEKARVMRRCNHDS